MVLRLSIRLLQNNLRSCQKSNQIYVPTSLHSYVSTAHLTLFYILHVFFVFVFQVPAEIRVPVEQSRHSSSGCVQTPEQTGGTAAVKPSPGITAGAVLCP